MTPAGPTGEICWPSANPNDNAILKLLASHFDRTYSVDLRYYRNYMGSGFSLSDYLRRNNITKVLLIGNVDYYISPDFALEN